MPTKIIAYGGDAKPEVYGFHLPLRRWEKTRLRAMINDDSIGEKQVDTDRRCRCWMLQGIAACSAAADMDTCYTLLHDVQSEAIIVTCSVSAKQQIVKASPRDSNENAMFSSPFPQVKNI